MWNLGGLWYHLLEFYLTFRCHLNPLRLVRRPRLSGIPNGWVGYKGAMFGFEALVDEQVFFHGIYMWIYIYTRYIYLWFLDVQQSLDNLELHSNIKLRRIHLFVWQWPFYPSNNHGFSGKWSKVVCEGKKSNLGWFTYSIHWKIGERVHGFSRNSRRKQYNLEGWGFRKTTRMTSHF